VDVPAYTGVVSLFLGDRTILFDLYKALCGSWQELQQNSRSFFVLKTTVKFLYYKHNFSIAAYANSNTLKAMQSGNYRQNVCHVYSFI
jgi:hypothetical protein